jgi:type VI secretion system protein ImpA
MTHYRARQHVASFLASDMDGADVALEEVGEATMIDVEVLLEPLSETLPSGGALDYDVGFLQLEIAARGRSEQQMGDAVSAGEEPDWLLVEQLALELCGRSKDLRVAVLLARARLHSADFAGLDEGLRLLAGYVERYWDSVHPQPEPGEDDTIRVNALAALSDAAGLLGEVRRTPLARAAGFGSVSLREVQIANRRLTPGADTPEIASVDIEGVFLTAAPADLVETAAALNNCLASLDAMAKTLTERGSFDYSGHFEALAEALRDGLAEIKSRAAPPTMPAEASEDLPAPVPAAIVPGEIRGRSDVVVLLE